MRWSGLKLLTPPVAFRLTEMILPLNLLVGLRGGNKFLLLMLTTVSLGVSGMLGKLNSDGGRTTMLPLPSPVVVSPFCCRVASLLATTSTTTLSSTCTTGNSSVTGMAPATRSKVFNTLLLTHTHTHTHTHTTQHNTHTHTQRKRKQQLVSYRLQVCTF